MTAAHSAQGVHQEVRHALRSASPWIARLARFGYAAKGTVYCLIGLLALLAAVGIGGQTTGSRGAIESLLGQPFGQVLVAIVAIGLAAYAMWCFVQAIEDPEQDGSDAKGIAKRFAHFGKGVIHLGLVFAAIGMVIGTQGGGGEENRADQWTSTLMSFPLGIWLVAAVGLCVLGYGLWQLYRGWVAKLDDQLNLYSLSAAAHKWVVRICRFGIGARGVVFGIIGTFLVIAAYHSNPSEAKGVGDALGTLREQPYGPWLLGVVALGLMSYGIYEFVRARYRLIEPA